VEVNVYQQQVWYGTSKTQTQTVESALWSDASGALPAPLR